MIPSSPNIFTNSNQLFPSTSQKKRFSKINSHDYRVWKELALHLKQTLEDQTNTIAKLKNELSLWKSRAWLLRNRSIYNQAREENGHGSEPRKLEAQRQNVSDRSFSDERTNEYPATQQCVATNSSWESTKNNRNGERWNSSVVLQEAANEDGASGNDAFGSSRGLSKLCSHSRSCKDSVAIQFVDKVDPLPSQHMEAGSGRTGVKKTKDKRMTKSRKSKASEHREAQRWSDRPCKRMMKDKKISPKELKNTVYKCRKGHWMKTIEGRLNGQNGSIACNQCGVEHLELKVWYNNCRKCNHFICHRCTLKQWCKHISNIDFSLRWGYDPKSVLAVESYRTWVRPITKGVCIYYQDRAKKYPYKTGNEGHYLLMQLVESTAKLLNLNSSFLEDHPGDAVAAIGEGEEMYHLKPNLRTKGFTWSQEEYSHLGFQRWYLHFKSFQRFTETWAILERALFAGVLDLTKTHLKIASIGGGPGFELLAFKLFFYHHSPHTKLKLASLDLCESWRPYVAAQGHRFEQWDLNGGGLLQKLGLTRGQLDYVIISNVLIYCTTEKIVKMSDWLLNKDGVRAILVTEREQKRLRACPKLESRGIRVIRLIDQSRGVDERQLAFVSRNLDLSECDRRSKVIFPNVPFEEHKPKKRFSDRKPAVE